MGTVAGIIAAFATSHLGGSALGGLLASKGWLGFAGQAGKLIAKRRLEKRAERAAADLKSWLDDNAEGPRE
jgi:hypothetical protein